MCWVDEEGRERGGGRVVTGIPSCFNVFVAIPVYAEVNRFAGCNATDRTVTCWPAAKISCTSCVATNQPQRFPGESVRRRVSINACPIRRLGGGDILRRLVGRYLNSRQDERRWRDRECRWMCCTELKGGM